MDSSEMKPMISCILEAPTCAGISIGTPTCTNLDRSHWYNLKLEKLNEKLYDDRLCVSIRLGLGASNDKEDDEIFRRWKVLHSFEQLFDVEPCQEEDSSFAGSDGNKITVSSDRDHEHAYSSVQLDWNQNREIQVRVRFNFVSSQFPFKRNLNSQNPIFNFIVRVSSMNTFCEQANLFAQLKLFWPGLSDRANHDAQFQTHKSELSTVQHCDYTKLKPFDPNQFDLDLDLLQNVDSLDNDYSQLNQETMNILNDYDEFVPEELENSTVVHYILEKPKESYFEVQNGERLLKSIFIQQNSSFSIVLKSSEQINRSDKLAVTRCELEQSSNQSFSKRDQIEWLNEHKCPMIEPDYCQTVLTSNVLDIRIVKANQIELIWIPTLETEEIVSFKVNCLCQDFGATQQLPFCFKSETLLKKLDNQTSLGSACIQVYTTKDEPNEEKRQFLLMKGLHKQNATPSLIILNNDELPTPNSTQFNNFLNPISLPLVQILLCLMAILLSVLLFNQFYAYATVQEIDLTIVNKMIEEKYDLQMRKLTNNQKFEHEKIEQMIELKFDAKYKDISLKEQQLEVQFKKCIEIETQIQKQLKTQTNSQIDTKVIDQLIVERFQLQLSNISLSEIEAEKIIQIVNEKLEQKNKLSMVEEKNEIKIDKVNQSLESIQSTNALEYILSAPTTAGIAKGNPTLTNLDRSTWYELSLKKLDPNLENDKLLISFRLGLQLSSSAVTKIEQNVLNQWKSLHPNERMFDLEPVVESQENYVILDNNRDSAYIDTASFYWNAKMFSKLRIRFNLVHCQFPFKRSLSSSLKDVTFFLHVKASSLTKSTSQVIDASVCQIKLFWPNGAAAANHRANQLLHQAQPHEKLVPSQLTTKLSAENFTKSSLTNEFVEDETFLEKLNTQIDSSKTTKLNNNNRNYLHYILADPIGTFVNVSTNSGEKVKGFFVEQNASFAIKLLPNVRTFSKVVNSIVRTQFELSLSERDFSEAELINWSASKTCPMIELNYLRSSLSEMIYDVRQLDANCVELIWLHKNHHDHQQLREFLVAFNVNAEYDREFQLNMKTFMIKSDHEISALDFGSSRIFVTEVGQTKSVAKKNWLQQNANNHLQTSESAILILNDAHDQGLERPAKKLDFNFDFPNLFRFNSLNVTGIIQFCVQWAVRVVLALMIFSYSINTYRDGLTSRSVGENVQGFLVVLLLVGSICVTFLI